MQSADDLKRAAALLRETYRFDSSSIGREGFILADRLDALARLEPIAWMYTAADQDKRRVSVSRWIVRSPELYWTETPLYAAPLQGKEVKDATVQSGRNASNAVTGAAHPNNADTATADLSSSSHRQT